jgi:competence protein ComEC
MIRLIYKYALRLYKELYSKIITEQRHLFLWIPVFYAIGILLYFSLPIEPNIIFSIILFIFAIILLIKRKLSLIAFILLGFSVTNFHTILIKPIILKEPLKSIKIIGTVCELTQVQSGVRIIICDPLIKELDPKLTPKRIRLTTRTSLNNATFGDKISIIASIEPAKAPALPGGYDFALKAYFEQIGAVGYSLSEAIILKKSFKNNFYIKISNFRQRLQDGINSYIGPRIGNIISALMIGEYFAIDKKILSEMRIAGISHILSVSGMHLSMVAGISFFFSRIILNIFYKYTARFDAKKIAGFIALIISFLYLLISGLQVAAVRSFIMVALVIVAVLFDRTSSAMRAISFAALIILIISPHNIINPSFQMSFAAVIALIASYELYLKIIDNYHPQTIFNKIKFYLYSTSFSSLIAGLATAPYAIYHFNQYSNYSILANLVAVPLTSFIIMPCVIIAFLLYPFDMLNFALYPMSKAIEIIVSNSHYIANLPSAVKLLPHIPNSCLLLITLGGLMLSLLSSKLRISGIIPIILSIIIICNNSKPDIFIDGKSKNFAINLNDGLKFSSNRFSRFTQSNWLNFIGTTKKNKINDNDLKIINNVCYINNLSYKLHFNCDNIRYLKINGDIYINDKMVLNYQNLINNYTSLIYINKDNIKVLSYSKNLHKRYWY